MNKKIIISGLLSISTIFATSICSAEMSAFNFHLTPYGGIDVGIQNLKFESGYGDNLFKKHLPKGNIFVGVKFNDYFGVEGGYESTLERKKELNIYGNHSYLGTNQVNLSTDYNNYSIKTKVSGWHAGITGEYPLFLRGTQKNPLSLLGYIGIKNTKLKLQSTLNYTQFVDPMLGRVIENQTHALNQNNKKTILRLAAGLQYFFHENFGIRILGEWEQISKIKPTNQGNPNFYQAKLKNSINYSIGFVLKK